MGIATLTKSAELLSPQLHILTPEELRQLHRLLLEMMNDFADMCRDNDIPWILAGGSALGTVRNNGFIPWDDDMDIAMFRSDFEKLKELFPEQCAEKYRLYTPGDENCISHLPRICKKKVSDRHLLSLPDLGDTIAIDILIMENVSNNGLVRVIHGMVCTFFATIITSIQMKQCRQLLLEYGIEPDRCCSLTKIQILFSTFFSFLPLEQWYRIQNRIFTACRDGKSKYVVIPSGGAGFWREIFFREKMNPGPPVAFENQFYSLPVGVDHYLSMIYGKSYMVPPPAGQQKQHFYIKFLCNYP